MARELAGTVLGRVGDLRQPHDSIESRAALITAFTTVGMSCGPIHPDRAEGTVFLVAIADDLRDVIQDPALRLNDS